MADGSSRQSSALIKRGGFPPWLALVGFLFATFTVAALGSLATTSNVDGWYATADRPWFTPPNWLFGPVWTVLYALIAIAAWLVWLRREGRPHRVRSALLWWWAQLVVNLAWTPVFFAGQWLWAGLAVIVTLDLLVARTLVAFAHLSRPAAWLLVPYLAWILYATALNAGIAVLN